MSQPQPRSGCRRGDTHSRRSAALTGNRGLNSGGSGSSGVRSAYRPAPASRIAAQVRYPADILVTNTVTISAPSTVPSIWLIPISPPSVPRWLTGTRSGSAAVSVASMPPSPSSAMNHPTAIIATEPDAATTAMPAAPVAAHSSVHGWRRPRAEVVRSESAPTTGLASNEATAPTPMTTESSTASAPLGTPFLPTWSCTEATCSGSSTWIGA